MVTRNRKHRLVRELGLYFAEKGRVLTAREYKVAQDRPKLLTMKEIVKTMGSYHSACQWIQKYESELWDTIHGIRPEPKPEPKPEVSPLDKLAKAKTGSEHE